MTDNFQYVEDVTVVGFEVDVDEDAGDPAQGRLSLPGLALRPEFAQERGRKAIFPYGGGPDKHQSKATHENFDLVLPHYLSTPFSTITGDEFVSKSLGTINATTGLVTPLVRPLPTLTVEYGFDGPTAKSFRLFEHLKINGYEIQMRPEDVIIARALCLARKYTRSATPVSTAGTDIDALALTTLPPATWEHFSVTFRDVPGGVEIPVNVKEFTLVWTNTITRERTDDQTLLASHLGEGRREFTFEMTTLKIDDSLLDIAEEDPISGPGQIDLEIIIDQPSGFFMSMRLPTCELTDPDTIDDPEGEGRILETYSGMQVGGPPSVIDFNKLA